jgi:acyl dehydratase
MADRELSGAPSMLPLFARAGVSLIPGASRLPFVGGGGGDVPANALTVSDVAVDRDRLAAYDRVCGFRLSDTLPPTYAHMLAFPLHLALMTSGSFPLPAIGLVHIANRIEQHRPLDAGERLSLRVWATPIYRHPRGRQFMIRTEARVGTELVWEEASTNLARGRGDESVPSPEGPPSSEALPATATWTLRGDLGRRYGSVSGDLNPIHVHPLTARLFGFRSAIAHGMWTTARCLAALDSELPSRFSVEVAFRRPILLPATVQFAERAAADAITFGVRDAKRDTPHLDGLVAR